MPDADKCLEPMAFLSSHDGLHVHCTFLRSTEHCSPCEDSKTQRLKLSKSPEENCSSSFASAIIRKRLESSSSRRRNAWKGSGHGSCPKDAVMEHCPGDGEKKKTALCLNPLRANAEPTAGSKEEGFPAE